MKRAVIFFATAALSLGGCSGKAKDPAAQAAPESEGNAAATASKPNPWNSDSAADAAAPEQAKKATAAQPAAKDTANPWAKDPPPGSVPAPDPAAKDQAKQ